MPISLLTYTDAHPCQQNTLPNGSIYFGFPTFRRLFFFCRQNLCRCRIPFIFFYVEINFSLGTRAILTTPGTGREIDGKGSPFDAALVYKFTSHDNFLFLFHFAIDSPAAAHFIAFTIRNFYVVYIPRPDTHNNNNSLSRIIKTLAGDIQNIYISIHFFCTLCLLVPLLKNAYVYT